MSSFLELIFTDLVFGLGVTLLVTAGCLLVSDEFKKFTAAKAFFYLTTVWICGRVLMWSVFTSETFGTRAVATFLAFGVLGVGLTEALRATTHRENSLRNVSEQEPKKPDIQQSSQGANSPNTNITGNNNTVTITPPHDAPRLVPPTFHEKAERVTFSLGEHGIIFGAGMDQLRKGPFRPLKFNDTEPVTLKLKGDTLLVDFKVWNGNDKPPIEVHNNEFTVRIPGCDKNSNASALEVINADGVVLFQLIRKTPTDVVVNGIFPSPTGGWIVAGPQGTQITRNPAGVLKPIFKYPAWKYPGQYAE